MTEASRLEGPVGYGFAAVLPICLVSTLLVLRVDAGPFWQWKLLDPSYFYLFDALNILNLQWPGNLAHPGVPVYTLGAAVIRLAHPLTPVSSLTDMILAAPEFYLGLISTALIVLNGLVLWGVGIVTLRVFASGFVVVVLQTAPFLSKLILKRGFLMTPESMLIATTLALVGVTVLALKPGTLERNGDRFAVAFGLAAGFAVSIKLTAAPIYVLPIFVLGNWRTAIVYGITTTVSFVLFMVPAWGSYPEFIDFISKAVIAPRPGSGLNAGSFGNLDAIIRILKRPVLNIPLALSALVLVATLIIEGLRNVIRNVELRTLFAIGIAQILQAVFIAKQANAYYMVPSFMLSPLSLVLSLRWLQGRLSATIPEFAKTTFMAVLTAAVVVGSGSSVWRLDNELRELKFRAFSSQPEKFDKCIRIFIYAASSPVYALYLGDRTTGFRFTDRLRKVIPDNDFWIDDWLDQSQLNLRSTKGLVAPGPVLKKAQQSCLYLRGLRPGRISAFLRRHAPEMAFDMSCSTPDEPIATAGVDCSGRTSTVKPN